MSLVSVRLVAVAALFAADVPGPKHEPLHPCDYASPDGAWVLHVDPSQRYGAGAARYRMSHLGSLAWEREHPFTFQQACVASDGTAIGYGSATGWPLQELKGEQVVAVLAPDGHVRGVEREPLVWPELTRPPYPSAGRLELYEDRDLAVLLVSDPSVSRYELWSYTLSTGKPLKRVVDDSARPRPGIAHTSGLPLPALDELPEIPLGQRGEVRFEPPQTSGGVRDLRFDRLDSLGRVLFLDREQFSALAFYPGGRVLLVAQPVPDDLGNGLANRLPMWAAARGDGGLFVRLKRGLVEFEPDGSRIGRSGEEDYLPPELCFVPGVGAWLVELTDGRISRLDASGKVVRVVERGANARWLRTLSSPVVARDGSLAVIDRAHAGGDFWVQRFEGDGRSVLSAPLPLRSVSDLAFDGHSFALLCEGRVLLLERDGSIAGRAQLAEGLVPDGLAFSPEGELWIFQGAWMMRCAVP